MSRALAVRWQAAAMVAVAVAVLVGGNAAGRPGLAVAVVVVQLALVGAALLLFETQPDAAALVGVAVAAADAVVLRSRTATAGSVAGVIGLSVVAVLLHQLFRRHPRSVTNAVCTALGAVVLGCGLALLLPLRELVDGRSAIFAGVLASGVALVSVRVLPGTSVAAGQDGLRRGVALLVGAAAALLCGLPSGGLGPADALLVGAGSSAAALLTDRLLTRVTVTTPAALVTVTALLPIALASPVAYLAGRVIAGSAG